jgi:hypothetical protein
MNRWLLVLVALLCGCPTEFDEGCEDGQAQCVGTSVIQYCEDGLWGEEESCQPREVAGGLTIVTYCYEDQGVCAP